MSLIYNPLLKIGLENTGNGSGDVDEKIAALQNAINDLQSSLNDLKGLKITKVTATSQLSDIENNEIFEWQADTQTVDGVVYINGYFYKKSSNTVVVVKTGELFLHNVNVSYVRGSYSIPKGYYVGIEWTSENVTGYYCNRNAESTRFYFSFLPAVVGQKALVSTVRDGFGDFIEYVSVSTVSNGAPSSYSDGIAVVPIVNAPLGNAKLYKFQNAENDNFAWFAVFQDGNSYFNYACAIIDNNIVYPMGRCNESITIAAEDIYESINTMARIDTQPSNSYTLPIATDTVLGGVKIGQFLKNSDNKLTLDFELFADGDPGWDTVDDGHFVVELVSLWGHITRLNVTCVTNFNTQHYYIVLPCSFLFAFYGNCIDVSGNVIASYSLSGNRLGIHKIDMQSDFAEIWDVLTIVAFT